VDGYHLRLFWEEIIMMHCKPIRRIALLVLAVGLVGTLPQQQAGCEDIAIETMLRAFADDYTATCGDSIGMIAALEIEPGGTWHVAVEPEGEVKLDRGPHPGAAFTLSMSLETMQRIYEGSMTAFTAAAQATGSDPAPLQLQVHEPAQDLPHPKEAMLGFLQHFFTLGRPERIILREENSRFVHGAHVIPLYYAEGFRSAWYKVKHGQRLNEPGDTNPYPQAFVIVSGKGRAKIGDTEVEVQAGESYFIPSNSDHVLWPDKGEELVIVWLAWGEGA
jgi:mannose-6-phosphate isomerase-like protein (cupin superfamily)